MKKLTKKQKEFLLELIREHLETLDDTEKDSWYDTSKGFAEDVFRSFLYDLGISLPEDESRS